MIEDTSGTAGALSLVTRATPAACNHAPVIREVRVQTTAGHKFAQEISVAGLTLVADEPTGSGGENLGPAPHEWLLAGLGACTSMTIKMYADRKAWPLDSVEVMLRAEQIGSGERLPGVTRQRTLEFPAMQGSRVPFDTVEKRVSKT